MICNWMNILVTFLAGLGLGAIASAMIKKNFEQKKLVFETKLLKYSNLISAYQDAVADSSEVKRQRYVSAQRQVELIANGKIIQLSKEFYRESAQTSPTIMGDLLAAMRKDLEISN